MYVQRYVLTNYWTFRKGLTELINIVSLVMTMSTTQISFKL